MVLAGRALGSLSDRTQKGSLIILRRWQRSCHRREFIPLKDLANAGAWRLQGKSIVTSK
jgi:hypothetical protein